MMEASSRAIPYPPSAGRPLALGIFGDERLAKLVASGNDRAFTVLFERYHQPLYRYCRSIVRHEVDAQDALQSTFAGALVALRRGRRDAPLRPWLFRIAHNESISLLRRRGPMQEAPDGAEPHVESAEERAQERERLALLVADLQELPDRQRGALVMRELSGLSHEEIAAALGTSPGTAKQAIFEARSAILEFAEGRAMSCEEICRRISDGDRRALRGRRVRAHLRDCGSCAAFAAAIPARRADLHALATPLAPLAAAGVIGRLTGGGSAFTGTGGGAAGTVAGKLAGAGLISKTLVTAAVMTGTAAGVAGTVIHLSHADLQSPPARVSAVPAARPGNHPARSYASGPASRIALERASGQGAAAHGRVSRHGAGASPKAVNPVASAHRSGHGRFGTGSANSAASATHSQGRGNSSHLSGAGSRRAAGGQSSHRSKANPRGFAAPSHGSASGSSGAPAGSGTPAANSALNGQAVSAAQHVGLKQGNAPHTSPR